MVHVIVINVIVLVKYRVTLRDRDLIVQELVDTAVFSPVSAKHHDSFQHIKLWLKSFDCEALLSWYM